MHLYFCGNDDAAQFKDLKSGDVFLYSIDKRRALENRFMMRVDPGSTLLKNRVKRYGLAVCLQTGRLEYIDFDTWVKPLEETGLEVR